MFRRQTRTAPEAPLDRDGLRAQIDKAASRRRTDDRDRQLRRLRHRLGVFELDHAAEARHPEPAATLPDGDDLPAFAPEDLTPELIRAGILRDGCVLVRGLIPRADALALAGAIDRAYADRAAGGGPYYDEFVPEERFGEVIVRAWIEAGGGLLAADSPRALRDFVDQLERSGFPRLVEGYLGEPPLLTFEKTTLRRAEPDVAGGWHQDGKFMGDVRALNLWLSLSRCGDEAPGLDIVPRRLDGLVDAGVDGAMLDYVVTDANAAEAARPKQVIRPIFEPGDALLFDELFLHKTGSDPSMPNPRYAVESWFFGASAFPGYAPIAV